MRRLLIVAYYFPPMGLSGVQRVAKFARYLPAYGWQPTVLTVDPRGYFAYDETLLREVQAAGVTMLRTVSPDPTLLFGRRRSVGLPAESARRRLTTLSQSLFIPDNKIGWFIPGLFRALRSHGVRPYDVVFSTAPPYTAHLIGAAFHALSGVPLVVDFRDDWLGNPRHVYPTALHTQLHQLLERAVLRRAASVLTIHERMAASFTSRHPDLSDRFEVISHGFDPADFQCGAPPSSVFEVLYSGVFYDVQRPDVFLRGFARWLSREPEARRDARATFVGLYPDAHRGLITRLDLEEQVELTGYLDHTQAVARLRAASVLWMTVGERPGSEGIVTSKLFEYFGARKPILGLVPAGAARDLLEQYRAAAILAPSDAAGVARHLAALYQQWKKGRLPKPPEDFVRRYDRKLLAGDLARVLTRAART